jgi:tetratricopeptide (TPR) repeat protein
LTSTAGDFVKKAVDLRESGRCAEAVIAARRATTMDETDANAWWQLALALVEEKGEEEACSAFEKTLDLSPSYSYGWHRLGLSYIRTERRDDAIESWEHAIELNADRFDSMRYLIYEYSQRNQDGDDEKSFELLKVIDRAGKLLTNEVSRLGTGYYIRSDYFNAIKQWKLYFAKSKDESGLFNLGLAHYEIKRFLDAFDYWNRALALNPKHGRAPERISRVLPDLIVLKDRVAENRIKLLDEDDWYSIYVNPIELLGLSEGEVLWPLDSKIVQKQKKLLYQEIELEDGEIGWVPGLRLDRSRAINIIEGLDGINGYFHYLIYENKPLLNFLCRGSLNFFMVSANESPVELLNALDYDWQFSAMLSRLFAKQYDHVLSNAVESELIDEVRLLVSGRILIRPEDEGECFESSLRFLRRVIEPLRNARENAKNEKPLLEDIKNILVIRLSGLISILPISFQAERVEIANLIRGIAIDAYNVHNDADLAMDILKLSAFLVHGVLSLKTQYYEDKEALDDRIKEAHKDEAFLSVKGAPHNITRAGVKFANIEIDNDDIESIRWGVLISHERGSTKHNYSMTINGSGSKHAKVEWYATENIEEQEKLFNKLVDAVFAYIIPTVMEKVRHAIDGGEIISIGGVQISKDGVIFSVNGWIWSKSHMCPWSRVRADLSNGELVLSDPGNSKAKTSMPLRDTNNAFVLYMMTE